MPIADEIGLFVEQVNVSFYKWPIFEEEFTAFAEMSFDRFIFCSLLFLISTGPLFANIEIDDGGTTTENSNLGTVSGNIIVKSNSTYILNGNISVLTGSIEVEEGSTIIINGDISDIQGSLTINGNMTLTGSLTAEGKLEVKGSGTTTLNGGSFESTGDGVVIESGSTLSLTNGSSIDIPNGNSIENSGTISADDSGNSISGNVTGSGSVDSDLGDCSSGCSDGTLPIELLHWAGKSVNNAVELTWSSATETNNDYYLVERSLDGGAQYEVVANVEGAGTSSETLHYKLIDHPPFFGNIIYRLTQIDFDGQFEVFSAIIVQHLKPNSISTLYPSLSQPEGPLTLRGAWGVAQNVDLRILDSQGKARYVTFQQSDDRIFINTRQLSAGLYFLKGTVNQVTVQEKFVILN